MATTEHLAAPSAWRAWCYLVWLSVQRQSRAHLMVWIALGLLGFMTLLIGIISPQAWDMRYWRAPQRRSFMHIETARWMRVVPFTGNPGALAAAGAYEA